jgi:hypothetical protein
MREESHVVKEWIFKLSGQSVRDTPTRFEDRCMQYGVHHRKSIRKRQWKYVEVTCKAMRIREIVE